MGKVLDPDYFKKYYLKNKEKLNLQSREYYKNNRESALQSQVIAARKRLYGVTEEHYILLLEVSNNCCQVCKIPFTKTPHIDHCHTTGKVRGLLCQECNTGLGIYEKHKNNFKAYLNED